MRPISEWGSLGIAARPQRLCWMRTVQRYCVKAPGVQLALCDGGTRRAVGFFTRFVGSTPTGSEDTPEGESGRT